jgi:hypothetical protein
MERSIFLDRKALYDIRQVTLQYSSKIYRLSIDSCLADYECPTLILTLTKQYSDKVSIFRLRSFGKIRCELRIEQRQQLDSCLAVLVRIRVTMNP